MLLVASLAQPVKRLNKEDVVLHGILRDIG